MGFGRNLAAWRRRAGLTQAALAARAGLTQPGLAVIETERRDVTLRTLYRLAEALGHAPESLLHPPPPPARLDRHALDGVAEAVVSGREPSDLALARLVHSVRAGLGPLLSAAAHASWTGRGAGVARRAELDWGSDLVEQVRARVAKRLAGAGA